MTSLVHRLTQDGVAILEIDHPPVNASSAALRAALIAALRWADARPAVASVVLACAGRTFMAGADIAEFDLDRMPAPDPNEVFSLIESLRKPVVAALHGTVLGGGLELAMACHARVADSGARLGLPEVKLGLLPGAGGTQRLPRLVGIEPAVELMLSGTSVSADRARELGLVDIVATQDLRAVAIALGRTLAGRPTTPRVTSRLPYQHDLADDYFDARAAKLPAENRGGFAARRIVDCVRLGFERGFDEGLTFERQQFEACRGASQSKALRHLFFAEREARRVAGVDLNDVLPVAQIGVVGAGTMGSGIAMCFADAGLAVVLNDVNAESLERGLAHIRHTYATGVAKGRLQEAQAQERLARIVTTDAVSDLAGCDLVVEAAFENLAVKTALCKRLGELCDAKTIIASNTSTLDIDLLAEASGRASRFLGMHFFSPAHVMKLLEVVRGRATSPQVLATALDVGRRIGKTPVVSGVCWGFIGNRMLEGYLRETEFLLMEGASPRQIDSAIEDVGLAMGPCKMIDMAGVDVAAKVVLERIKAGGVPPDPSYRAVVRELFEQGRFGQKASSGYYRYFGRVAEEDPAVRQITMMLADRHGIVRRSAISDAEIVERCLYPLVNEGAFILEEGVALRAGDIDVVWTQGYGFPTWLGGPMHWARETGIDRIVGGLRRQASFAEDRHGYWRISPLLARLASDNQAWPAGGGA